MFVETVKLVKTWILDFNFKRKKIKAIRTREFKMSGLNIRTFAKVEPSDGENSNANQERNQGNLRMQNRNETDSDDSDAGIQYLAPDDTPAGKW